MTTETHAHTHTHIRTNDPLKRMERWEVFARPPARLMNPPGGNFGIGNAVGLSIDRASPSDRSEVDAEAEFSSGPRGEHNFFGMGICFGLGPQPLTQVLGGWPKLLPRGADVNPAPSHESPSCKPCRRSPSSPMVSSGATSSKGRRALESCIEPRTASQGSANAYVGSKPWQCFSATAANASAMTMASRSVDMSTMDAVDAICASLLGLIPLLSLSGTDDVRIVGACAHILT